MKSWSCPAWPLSAAFLLLGAHRLASAEVSAPRVVINEIMYHPPDDRDDLQFIELLNPGTNGVNLSGWSFTKGCRFDFPNGTQLRASGCVVICHDLTAFKAQYSGATNVAGAFTGKLSHNGERIELFDVQGRLVDTVKFGDRAPWPLGADGYGSSLERICPAASGDDPANWASAELKRDDRIGGTPGRANGGFSAIPLPSISEVCFAPAVPDRPVPVTAAIEDATGVQSVTLAWWVWSGLGTAKWAETAMKRVSGDAKRGVYEANIPAQPEGRLIRFTVRAKSVSGAERNCPSKTEPRPTFSFTTWVNPNSADIPFLKVLTLGSASPQPPPRFRPSSTKRGASVPLEPRELANGAVIHLPRDRKEVQLFDHVHVRPRNGGWKVHFHKDQPLDQMTGINLLFEASPRYVLAEPLAYDLYRKAGVPAPASYHVRLWKDQQPLGYHLLVEQPNKTFLRRQDWDEDGNLYKLLWYGQGVVGQHEKKTNPHTGHQDLVTLVERLNGTTGAAQWEFIQKEFQVEEMINYYAVNMCIQNWDGFFNNYFAYHDLRPGGQWRVIPWDEDKTWGDYDGASHRYNWVEMPLTYGMNGSQSARSWLGGGPFGGTAWWRPPGYFSGPLLANPEFRKRFLIRLREICNTIFTPEKMGPAVNALAARLEGEVRVRAELAGQDLAAARQEFQNDIQSFHNQITNRRKFILKELGVGP